MSIIAMRVATSLRSNNGRFLRWTFAVVGIGLSLTFATAADRPARHAPVETDQDLSRQDLLLLGPLEPLRIRITVEVDGIPFRTAWRNIFDRLFDQFDLDHDGRLNTDQMRQVIVLFARESGSVQNQQSEKMIMTRDTVITRDDLRNQIERLAPPLTLRQRLSSGGAGPALVPLLDTDGDHRLSRDELMAAEQSLHCRDFNDDQMIIEQELLAGPNLSSSAASEENGVGNGSVILLKEASDADVTVADILLARYDRNRDGLLSLAPPAEIIAADGRLAGLDTDQNQQLDRNELRGFLKLPLDASLPFSLGSAKPGGQNKGEALAQFRLRRKLDGGYRIHFGASEIDFRRNNRDPSQDNVRPSLSTFDTDMNQYLDETEFANVPDRPDFAIVDTDKDGKVSSAEFDFFFIQRSRALSAQLVVEVSDQGSDLFTSLDKNFDRVLTPRELHQAVKLLDTEDRDGDGFLGGIEMSYNLILELSRGGPRVAQNNLIAIRGTSEPQVKAERGGPTWFIKMDRNRDGDVSLLEFVGDRKVFESLDLDGDGLISVPEAQAANEKKRSAN